MSFLLIGNRLNVFFPSISLTNLEPMPLMLTNFHLVHKQTVPISIAMKILWLLDMKILVPLNINKLSTTTSIPIASLAKRMDLACIVSMEKHLMRMGPAEETLKILRPPPNFWMILMVITPLEHPTP